MPVSDLAAELAADRLHVIVFGPGYGESVAVHIPNGGWLVCDSLSRERGSSDFVPAIELLTTRQERASALVLTHPHDDHVAGFDRLVHEMADGPVGLAGILLPEDGFTESDDAAEVLAKSARLKALAAVMAHWRSHPDRRWDLVAGEAPFQLGEAKIEVLHPSDAYLKRGYPDPTQAPNAFSTPVLISWEATRIILGADLPNPEWNEVLGRAREDDLADHGALKVSHHASKGALNETLIRSGARDQMVIVTPWQLGGRHLPKLHEEGGVVWLLARRSAVNLTSPGRALTSEPSRPISIVDLNAAVDRRALPGGAGSIEIKRVTNPDESWVAATFDAHGNLESTKHGRDALIVVD